MRVLSMLAMVLAASAAHAQPRPARDGLPSRWARAPQLDLARSAMRVDVAWERFGLAGRGATVCVVDTGVDLTHRDFIDADGHTRVDWLLDLDAAPRGSFGALEARFGGAVHDGAELDALVHDDPAALPSDWHGHGTAMASAAVGDDAPLGVSTPGLHAGVAPLARLVVVRALRRGVGGFEDADIVGGVGFCAAVADPARTVVLLALGGHDGAHDGTEPIERALAGFVHRGTTIVVAAGNESGRASHAGARVAEDAIERITLRVPSPDDPTDAHVALAVRGASQLVVVAPDGARTPPIATGTDVSLRSGSALVSISARDGALDVVIAGDDETRLVGGDYVVEIAGPARFDAWIVDAQLGNGLGRASLIGRSVVIGDEVTIPATTDSVIAVGSSVSRAFLPRADGGAGVTLEADGEGRATFSAIGPSVTGAPRPDVLAPGGVIVAAFSAGVVEGDRENMFRGDVDAMEHLRQGEDHVAIVGTSVSAALVAGALALSYESAGGDPLRDRSLLALTATRDVLPFTPARGFGAIDVPAFLAARALEAGAIDGLSLTATRAFVTPGATDLGLVAVTTSLSGVPTDAWVTFARDGEVLAREPLVAGIARARVPVGRVLVGEHVSFTATALDRTASAAVLVTLDEDGSLARPWGGGSCSASHARGDGRVALLALVLLFSARTSGRRRPSA